MTTWRTIILLILTGMFSFGGSFTCTSGDTDRSDVEVTTP
jgi:hypothetical protein